MATDMMYRHCLPDNINIWLAGHSSEIIDLPMLDFFYGLKVQKKLFIHKYFFMDINFSGT